MGGGQKGAGKNPSRQQGRQQQPARDVLPATPRASGVQHHRMELSYKAPLPPPAILREYDEIYPGAAQLIFEAFERQSKHRQELEHEVITSDIKRSAQGLWAGFAVSLAGLGVSLWLGLAGHDILAGISFITDIATLAGVFVYGSQSRKHERLKKAEILAGERAEND